MSNPRAMHVKYMFYREKKKGLFLQFPLMRSKLSIAYNKM